MILPREAEAMRCLPLFRIAGFMDHSKLCLNSILRVLNLQRHHRKKSTSHRVNSKWDKKIQEADSYHKDWPLEGEVQMDQMEAVSAE